MFMDRREIIMAVEKKSIAKPATAAAPAKAEVKAEAKKPAAVKKAAPAKKPAAKKEAAKKPAEAKACAEKKCDINAKVVFQFCDKEYTKCDLVKIAKDVWQYDLKKDVAALKDIELYVKPEECKVYYVMNGETGSFDI